MANEASPPSDSIASFLSPFLRVPVPVIQKRAYYYSNPIPYWVYILIGCVCLVLTVIAILFLVGAMRKRNQVRAPPVPLVVPSQYANPGMYGQGPQQYYQPAPNPNQHLSGYYAPPVIAPAGNVARPAPAASQDVRGFYEPGPTQGVGGQGATVR